MRERQKTYGRDEIRDRFAEVMHSESVLELRSLGTLGVSVIRAKVPGALVSIQSTNDPKRKIVVYVHPDGGVWPLYPEVMGGGGNAFESSFERVLAMIIRKGLTTGKRDE
jgi:hypothetical protein